MITARAVTVTAGIVSLYHMPATVAYFPMGAELSTLAMFDIIHHLVLTGMQRVGDP